MILEQRQPFRNDNGTTTFVDGDGNVETTGHGNFWYSTVSYFGKRGRPATDRETESRDNQMGCRCGNNLHRPVVVRRRTLPRKETSEEGHEAIALP